MFSSQRNPIPRFPPKFALKQDTTVKVFSFCRTGSAAQQRNFPQLKEWVIPEHLRFLLNRSQKKIWQTVDWIMACSKPGQLLWGFNGESEVDRGGGGKKACNKAMFERSGCW